MAKQGIRSTRPEQEGHTAMMSGLATNNLRLAVTKNEKIQSSAVFHTSTLLCTKFGKNISKYASYLMIE